MDQFFEFQTQLEQSALYYSTMAMRQMNIGYESQLPNPGAMLNQPPSNNPTRADRHSSGGTVAFKQCYQNPPLPAINVTMAGHGNEEDDFYMDFGKQRTVKWAKGVRKVNFAYPLSVIKIKSPTPMHSLEDFGSAMLTSSNGVVGGYGWDNQGAGRAGLLYSDDSDTCGDDKETEGNEADDNDSAYYVHGVAEEGTNEDNGNSRHRRRKRRKKRKNSGQADYELNYVEPNLNDNDPYAIYEVPLNEHNYEFVSKLRLCTEDDFTKIDTDTESEQAGNSTTEGDADIKGRVNDDVLKEMQQLYGDIGAQRIIQMEEVIEKYYRREATGLR